MRNYVLKRLLLLFPTLFIVSFIVFSLARLIPGDVVDMMFEDQAYAKDLQEMRRKLGIDKAIHLQYVTWVTKVVRGILECRCGPRNPFSMKFWHGFPSVWNWGR